MIKDDAHIFCGLRQDVSIARTEVQYLTDALNVRILHNGKNEYAITSEKGYNTASMRKSVTNGYQTTTLYIRGTLLGQTTIAGNIVVFTWENIPNGVSPNGETHIDRIYKLKATENDPAVFDVYLLYEGDLGFDYQHPIQTFGVFESELLIKVYWIDGLHELRSINIMYGEMNDYTATYLTTGNVDDSYILVFQDAMLFYQQNPDYFNASASLSLTETVEIKPVASGRTGLFKGGVIQYGFTYSYNYGKESALVYMSPLIPIMKYEPVSLCLRALSEEEECNIGFEISIHNLDLKYDNLNIYALQRTSIDAIPIARKVISLSLKDLETSQVTYIDVNDGETIDAASLNYLGADKIIPQTMECKDNTLFLGNIKNERQDFTEEERAVFYDDDLQLTVGFSDNYPKTLSFNENNYFNKNWANGFAGFKTHEVYKFGIQFQHENGYWSSPIELGNFQIPVKRPSDNFTADQFYLYKNFYAYNDFALAISKGYKKVRGVVALPVIKRCPMRGILNPTMISLNNITDNENKIGTYQSSWFFRPFYSFANMQTFESIYFQEFHPLQGYNPTYRFAAKMNFLEFRNDSILPPNIFANSEIQSNCGSLLYNLFYHITPFTSSTTQQMYYPPYNPFEPNHSWSMCGMSNHEYYPDDLYHLGYHFWTNTLGLTSKKTQNGNHIDFYFYDKAGESTLDDVFRVSYNYTTFHSPEIEYQKNTKFNADTIYCDNEFVYQVKNGFDFNLSATSGLHPNSASTKSMQSYYDNLFRGVGNYKTIGDVKPNGTSGYGLCSNFLFEDFLYDDPKDKNTISDYNNNDNGTYPCYFMTYPWHGDALANTPSNDQYTYYYERAKINQKIISNIKVFDFAKIKNGYDTININISNPNFSYYNYSSESEITIPFGQNGFYKANINTLLTHGNVNKYTFVFADSQLLTGADLNGGFNIPVDCQIKLGETMFFTVAHNDNLDVIKIDSSGDDDMTFVMPFNRQYTLWCRNWNHYNESFWNKPLRSTWRSFFTTGKAAFYWKIGDHDTSFIASKSPIRMKYKSSPHLVFNVPEYYEAAFYDITTEPTRSAEQFDVGYQNVFPLIDLINSNVTVQNAYDSSNITNLTWIPSGPAITIPTSQEALNINVIWKNADTWLAPYSCLKTYPYDSKDINQIIEIGEFPLESRYCTFGRYDKKINIPPLSASPESFVKINDVYSQTDNFFNYKILPDLFYKINNYPTSIAFSLQKQNGNLKDNYLAINMSSVYDVDGKYGEIKHLKFFNNNIIIFQESGISTLLFNSRVQISTQDGVPIEITNNYKVSGNIYNSYTLGVHSKWHIVDTEVGLFFLDTNNHFYQIAKAEGLQFNNISLQRFTESVFYDKFNTRVLYYPRTFINNNQQAASSGTTLFADKKHSDVYIHNSTNGVLGYSNDLNEFESFFSYEKCTAMFSFNNKLFATTSINDDEGEEYYRTFTRLNVLRVENKRWYLGNSDKNYISFISNAEPARDKIFTNFTVHADFYGTRSSDVLLTNKTNPINNMSLVTKMFFDKVRVKTEYQDSDDVSLTFKNVKVSNTKKKFREWRVDIPRDKDHPLQRMRNTWMQATFTVDSSDCDYFEIHDMHTNYFV